MYGQELRQLTERIQILEDRRKQNKRVTIGVALSVTIMAFCCALAPQKPVSIVAEYIALRDREGHVRAEFSVEDDRSVQLRFYEPNGDRRATMGLTSDGTTAIVFTDAKGKPQVTLTGRSETRHFALYDTDGNERVNMGLTPNGDPVMSCIEKSGMQRIALGVMDNGVAGLNIAGVEGKSRIKIDTRRDGSARFMIQNRDDKVQTYLGLDAEGAAQLALLDRLGLSRVDLRCFPENESSLVFSDNNKLSRLAFGLMNNSACLATPDGTAPPWRVLEEEKAMPAARSFTVPGGN